MELTDTHIERWRLLLEEANADPEWLAYHKERDTKRLVAQRELLELLDEYLRTRIDTEQFRSIFDRRTRGDWDLFGLKGMSGAMLLNMFVKYVPDEEALSNHLRAVLPVPENAGRGRERMNKFQNFVGGLISSGNVLKRQVQPARIPFFVSAWWHLQNTERWPVFYVSARKALEMEELYSPTWDPIEDYFAFRDVFLTLASALGIESWVLEHLCSRYEKQDKDSPDGAIGAVTFDGPREARFTRAQQETTQKDEELTQDSGTVGTRHTQVQWLLAKIGRKFGCRIWIAANDQNKRWNGERLGALSLVALPSLGIDNESQRIIELIDVL